MMMLMIKDDAYSDDDDSAIFPSRVCVLRIQKS